RVTGGGANIWAGVDAFHFVWKKLSGDMALTADVEFVGAGAVAHRKAVLMIRQNLEPGSAYADIALHGDGLTSLQFRPAASAATQELRLDLKMPRRIRIERRRDAFTVFAGNPGETLKAAGPATVALQDPVYVGLGVCSHQADILETAVFSNVKLDALPPAAAPRPRYASRISVYDLRDKSVRVVYRDNEVFEAPNWSLDGQYLLSNSRGRLYRIPAGGGAAEPLALDPSLRANNDHGYSPDGKLLALSASSPSSRQSQVYVAAADGSNARLVVAATPSYFHGWSPDGRFFSFIAQRDGKNFDIYRVPAAGGQEERLTVSPGYDDGSDYSPDGKWIYFNSDRSGGWDIWRIPAGGAGPGDVHAERITSDELEDWFPHPSPDGKWLLFFSFPKGTAGHNDKMSGVQLRLMPLPGDKLAPGPVQVLQTFFGGQGTINVNSWAPDSKRFAYVVYEPPAP
ncbi:MAG: PD40 domain-containing protein, partial [Acidobacteria bacterium]|nr:PD40 domain-containing protein [Acidobacteriota bacterium]